MKKKFAVVGVVVSASLGLLFLGERTSEEVPTVPPATSTPLPTISPRPSPTAQPTKKPYVKAVVAPHVSKIDCTGPDGVVFKTTQKECDEFNNAWNKPKPTQAPVQNTGGSTYTYEAPDYEPCTVDYKYLGSRTYNYMTAEQCKDAQDGVAGGSTDTYEPRPTSTPKPPAPTVSCDFVRSGCGAQREINRNNCINMYGSNTGTLEFCMQQEVNPAYRSCLGSC